MSHMPCLPPFFCWTLAVIAVHVKVCPAAAALKPCLYECISTQLAQAEAASRSCASEPHTALLSLLRLGVQGEP